MQIVIVAGPGQGDQQVGFADPHSDMGLLEEGLVVLLQVLVLKAYGAPTIFSGSSVWGEGHLFVLMLH